MKGHRLKGLPSPSASSDPATRGYVDDQLAELSTQKTNYTAADAPTVSDDSNAGYSEGSEWQTPTAIYICMDATPGAAVWEQIWPALTADAGFLPLSGGTLTGDLYVADAGFEKFFIENTGTGGMVWAHGVGLTGFFPNKYALGALDVGRTHGIGDGPLIGGMVFENINRGGASSCIKVATTTPDGTARNILDDGAGKMGIGTTAPQSIFHIKVATNQNIIFNTFGVENTFEVKNDAGDTFVPIGFYASEYNFPQGGVVIGSAASPGTNNLYVVGDVSAASFTTRTKFFVGDAITELKKIKAKSGKLDHGTLPDFLKSTYQGMDGNAKPGQDLGATVSMLTVAVQQLTEKVEKLESMITEA